MTDVTCSNPKTKCPYKGSQACHRCATAIPVAEVAKARRKAAYERRVTRRG